MRSAGARERDITVTHLLCIGMGLGYGAIVIACAIVIWRVTDPASRSTP